MQPSTSWREVIPEDEAARHDAQAAILRGIQREHAAKAPKGRALHYKQHAAFTAELEIDAGAPSWARVGIFGAPGKYKALVRFSNGGGTRLADAKPDVRGIAVKVMGVPGKKLIAGMEDAATQDFLGILGDATPFRTVEEFVGTVRAASGSPLLALPRLIGTLGFGRFASVLKSLQAGMSRRVESLAEETFNSVLPIRWGDHAVKFSFAPLAPIPKPASPVDPTAKHRLGDDLVARASSGALRYELRVQPYLDDERTPLEDPTRAWLATDSPWVKVATLTIPKQDATSARGQELATLASTLSFDPWHAPVEFRPLGAFMRARSAAYRESVIERQAAKEPTGSEPIFG
ncbi:MAG: hypothetical protein U0271_36185 [Polyangiaceae bacterium]